MQARLVRQVLMSGVKDRFTLPGTKKNREDLSIDQRLPHHQELPHERRDDRVLRGAHQDATRHRRNQKEPQSNEEAKIRQERKTAPGRRRELRLPNSTGCPIMNSSR